MDNEIKKSNGVEFDEWFDRFMDECRILGYPGRIDRGSAEMDYNDDKSAEDAAEELVEELMNN